MNDDLKLVSIWNKNLHRPPKLLTKFQRLKKLALRANQISDISRLKELTELTHLDLSRNKISDISSLKELTELTYLDLSRNKISDISSLKELTELKHLDLSRNKINDVSSLKELTKLTYLNLHINQISDVSSLKELKNLKTLYLLDNKITHIPAEFLDMGMEIEWEWLGEFEGIFLVGNPLELPPVEIVEQGNEAIRQYFKSLTGEKRALNEVKVLFVGDGAAGKTSLVKQLLGKRFDKNEFQTHGINIETWKIEVNNTPLTIRLWDFGGQEIMHATHQFFLSKRSLYILVLDGRKDENPEYWLKHIESFGGDSPVLVVLNKIDENPGFDVNRSFLKRKYSNIKGFYRLSCANKTGIEDFSRDLGEALLKVKMLQTTWPTSWINVKIALEQMKEHFIDYHTYEKMCLKEKIIDAAGRDTLLDFLNDLGVVLHFKEFDLEDTHVLEPKWVTEAVYKIINSGKLAQSNGILNIRNLDEILKKKSPKDYFYPKDKYRYIITLMKKFELCYSLDDETVLIPDLLTVVEPPIDFDYSVARPLLNKNATLAFIVQYDFLPRSVIPRFIVNMHESIKGDLQWRTGVVLEDLEFQSTAVVKADHEAKRIYLHVQGGQKRDYFAVLLATLRRINQSYEKLKTTELVPMPDDEEITVNYKHLIRLEKRGIDLYLPGESEKEYRVKDLLGSISGGKATEEEVLKLLRKIKTDQDTMETLLKKANDTVMLQPNIMGFGFNLNALVQKVLLKKKKEKPE
ncbi:MAG: COR domain-containing protein [Candidatus Ranarchaeia archaeon]|jgi:small GTP-binding protein